MTIIRIVADILGESATRHFYFENQAACDEFASRLEESGRGFVTAEAPFQISSVSHALWLCGVQIEETEA